MQYISPFGWTTDCSDARTFLIHATPICRCSVKQEYPLSPISLAIQIHFALSSNSWKVFRPVFPDSGCFTLYAKYFDEVVFQKTDHENMVSFRFFVLFSGRHHHLAELYTKIPTELHVHDVVRAHSVFNLLRKMAIVWAAQRSGTHTHTHTHTMDDGDCRLRHINAFQQHIVVGWISTRTSKKKKKTKNHMRSLSWNFKCGKDESETYSSFINSCLNTSRVLCENWYYMCRNIVGWAIGKCSMEE